MEVKRGYSLSEVIVFSLFYQVVTEAQQGALPAKMLLPLDYWAWVEKQKSFCCPSKIDGIFFEENTIF